MRTVFVLIAFIYISNGAKFSIIENGFYHQKDFKMKYKHNIIYSALLATFTLPAFSQSLSELDEVNVIAELEKFKASDKLKDVVNLSLLGKQLAFTSGINVVNYDEKILADQNARNLVDAIAKTDPSVMNFGGETNTLSGVYVRGLQLDTRQMSLNGLSGLYSSYNTPVAGVASAQLIKGASTAVVGMDPEGSSGASVNIETKRATDKPINKIGFGWIGSSRLEETFDFGRRFGEKGEWGIRLNGKYRDGETKRTNYDERNKEFAVGADYRGEKLRLGLDYMYTKRATHGGRARVQDIQNFTYTLPSAPEGSTNLNPRWIGQTTEDQTVLGTFEYDLADNLMLSGGIGHMESEYSGAFGQITRLASDGTFSINGIRGFRFKSRTTSGNLKLQGNFETGSISHNWSLAFDSVTRQRSHKQSAKTNYSITAGSIYQPQFARLSSTADLSANTQATETKLQAHSLALADTLGFVEDKIRLTLGGRLQWIKQKNYLAQTAIHKSRFSPMVTLAYVPHPNLVVYGNYLQDLEPGNTDPDTGEMMSPRVTEQIELGLRQNWSETLTTTFSVYELSRPGIVRSTGKEQGEERNRGIEFNLYASLLDKTLRPSFGIAYNQGKVFDYPTYAGEIVSGVQVTNPRIIAKAAIEWDMPFVSGLTLNAAAQYYGKSYQDTKANYRLPSYTTVDFGAKYIYKINSNQDLTFRAGVENAFNKHYWQIQRGQYDRSFAVLGMPRTYWANMEYSF